MSIGLRFHLCMLFQLVAIATCLFILPSCSSKAKPADSTTVFDGGDSGSIGDGKGFDMGKYADGFDNVAKTIDKVVPD